MREWLALPFILCVFVFFSGCAGTGPTGGWRMSREAKGVFESKRILENHSYYYSGSRVRPDAIIAVSNEFALRSKLWVPVDITPSILGQWMAMYRTEISYTCPYMGGYITTPENRIIGTWYAKDTLNTIRFPEPGVIEVYQPFSVPGSLCDRERILDDL